MLDRNGEAFTLSLARISLSHNGKLSVYDKMLYLVICHYCYGDKVEAFPSRNVLAAILGCSTKKISDSSKKLEQLGLIKKKQRMDNSVVYTLQEINDNIKAQFPAFDHNKLKAQIQGDKWNELENGEVNTEGTTVITLENYSNTNNQNRINKNNIADANAIFNDIGHVVSKDDIKDMVNFFQLDKFKKLHILASGYVTRCTKEELHVDGKYNRAYYQVRNFLFKKPDSELNYLYDYLYTIGDKQVMSLTEFYEAAKKYRDYLNVEAKKPKARVATVQPEYTVEDFLALDTGKAANTYHYDDELN